MYDLVTIITPTRNRPECIGLLERWMARQTYRGQVQWIVATDGEPPPLHMSQRLVQTPTLSVEGGIHSLCANLLNGLAAREGECVLVMEDDDWYAPDYIESMTAPLWRGVELVGTLPEKYFNVASRRYHRFKPGWHASLAATGFRGPAIDLLTSVAAKGDPLMDMAIWRHYGGSRPTEVLVNEVLHVGIKGMPGTKGIGMGHRSRMGTADPECSVLKEWIGDDIEAYRPWFGSPVPDH